jgi:L-alanine-DL-glutamate epimerase-like enolase superfamily enzyme
MAIVNEFEIEAVEAFHITLGGKKYWETFKPDDRLSSGRYLLKENWRTVYGRVVETCLVKVTLKNGPTGWGEATEPICPEIIAIIATELIAPLSSGVKFASIDEFRKFAYDLNRGRGHLSGYHLLAIAALDMALCDAMAKSRQVSVARDFNNNATGTFGVYLSGIRRNSREERAAFLASLVEDGLQAAKIFVDSDTEETAREVAYLRSAVDGDWQLMVDALWSFERIDDAQRLREMLDTHDVTWLECPIIPEDLSSHKTLCKKAGIPIALGEHFFTHWQLQDWVDARALHIFQPDIGRTGFCGGVVMADMAKAAGIQVTPHMGTGSPVVQAAALQFYSAVCDTLPCEFQLDLANPLPEVFESAWNYHNGSMTLPDAPGLGVQINEKNLQEYIVTNLSFISRSGI